MMRWMMTGVIALFCAVIMNSSACAQAPIVIDLAVYALPGLAMGAGQHAGQEIYDHIKGPSASQSQPPAGGDTAPPASTPPGAQPPQVVPIMPPTPADGIHWTLRNEYGSDIILQFYSPARHVHWPRGDHAFRLISGQPAVIRLRCVPGEKICYGGAVPGRYWGTGLALRHQCLNCCRLCGSEGDGVTLR
jgi:hypothetical protein